MVRPLVLNFHERPLTQVKLNAEGDLLLTSAKDGFACLSRVSDGERIGMYKISETVGSKASAVFSIDMTKNAAYVVTASADGTVCIFEALTGVEVCKDNLQGAVRFAQWNQKPLYQNKLCVCVDKFANRTPAKIVVYEFHPKRKKLEEMISIDEELPMKATQAHWGPFDKILISIHEEGTVHVWDAVSGSALNSFEGHQSAITSLQFSPNMEMMVTSSKDHKVKLWRTDTFDCIKSYDADRPLNDAAISPLYTDSHNVRYHIITGGGQEARDVTTTALKGKFETLIFHMVFEEELGSIKGHFGPINTLAVMPNGLGFVTGGEDGNVRINMFDADYLHNKRLE